MPTLNRNQYLQARATLQLVQGALSTLDVPALLATIDQAVSSGPKNSPEMWSEGLPKLQSDRALFVAAQDLQGKT